jgi:hypothetical protein
MTSFMQIAEISRGGGKILEFPSTKDDIRSLSEAARLEIIIDLAARLDEASRLAYERDRDALVAMLVYLSVSFRDSAAEIASESYGPFLIEQMLASVKRIEANFAD